MLHSNLLLVGWQQLTSSGDLSYLGAQWRRDVAFAGYNIALQVSHLVSRVSPCVDSHLACASPTSAALLAEVLTACNSSQAQNIVSVIAYHARVRSWAFYGNTTASHLFTLGLAQSTRTSCTLLTTYD